TPVVPGRARLSQVPAEFRAVSEGGQVGFAVDFGSGVALAVGEESRGGVHQPPRRRLAPQDAKPELQRSRRVHRLRPLGLRRASAFFGERFGFARAPSAPACGSPSRPGPFAASAAGSPLPPTREDVSGAAAASWPAF